MGSLSNLYISQSYTSLIHLGSNTSASATQVELEDGVGQGLGIFVNTNGDVSIDGSLIVSGTFDIEGRIIVNDNVRINGNLEVSGSTRLTGSLVVSNAITASNAFIQNDLNVGGTVFASKVVTLIESSSIIFSSGSNILGDEITDTQTLIGSVIISGSGALTGSLGISNNLSVDGNISSSTISGIGNVTSYSQSVDARLDFLEGPFSTSVDSRLDSLENFSSSTFNTFSQSVDARLDVVEATASLYIPFSTSVDSRLDFLEGPFSTSVDARLDVVEATASLYIPFSTSVDARLDALEAFTGSEGLLSTASFNAYTSSTNADLAAIHQTTASLNTSTASLNAYTQSNDIALNSLSQSVSASNGLTNNRINVLSSFTGSYATTGSNTFVGNETFSGSVAGVVVPLTVSSNTASMDCSLGNFFTITLPTSSVTFINPTNIRSGTTISLRITQPSVVGGNAGTVAFNTNSVKFPQAFPYIATPITGAIDILSFQSYDTSTLFGVAVNTMI
jgi:hypothetical protein